MMSLCLFMPRRHAIAAAIAAHPVMIVSGETGSGKSTQLPKICLEMGRGVDGMIGHTQPRRIAARSIAARLAEELGTPLGDRVGYKIRFSDRTGPGTYVKVMTDGVLLAETPSDRFLRQYETIIVDEAHERSLNIDFLLGYLTRLLPQRPELRCIITSATIDARRLSEHFADVRRDRLRSSRSPVAAIRSRSAIAFPNPTADGEEPEMTDQTVAAVGELVREQRGDLLVFLPTERDIRETAAALGRRGGRGERPLELLPLYARLSAQEQNRVFAPHSGQRVVLATNVAESVADRAGDPRRHRHRHRGSAVTRPDPRSRGCRSRRFRGRRPTSVPGGAAGLARGFVCGLYSEEDYLGRDRFTTPEIRRTNLATVILQTLAWKLGPIEEFPFLDPPRGDAIHGRIPHPVRTGCHRRTAAIDRGGAAAQPPAGGPADRTDDPGGR